MKLQSVDIRGLAATGIRRSAWGTVPICLCLALFAPQGFTQEPATALHPPTTAQKLDVPYFGDKAAMEKLAHAPAGVITDVTTSLEGPNLVVSVLSSCNPAYQEFDLGNPPRLVLDFLNIETKAPIFNHSLGSAGVRKLRVAQFQDADPKITRLVFDLDDNYGNHVIAPAPHGVQITFHPAQAPDASASKGSAAAPSVAEAQTRPPAKPPKTQAADSGADRLAAIVPVISDLSASEIPQSALATAASQPEVHVAPPPAQAAALPAEPPPLPEPPPPPPAPALPQEGYSGHPLSIDVVNVALVDIFRLLAEEGGINIVVDPDVKGTASVKMTKTPWDQVFDVILKNNSLEKQVDGNVVRIATKKTIQAEAKQVEDLKKQQLLAADVETRVRRLNYAKPARLIESLKDQMTVRGLIVTDERTGSLIITDVPDSLNRVMHLVDMLDTPEPQVEIEARIVAASRDFARDIGIQFGFVEGNLQRVTVGGPNTFGTIGGTRPSTTPANTYAAGNGTTGRGASQDSTSESGGVSTGTKSSDNPGNFNVNLPSLLPFGGIGVSIGNILDTFLLDAAITAGENKGQAKLISQPKLTTQNNSSGTITQGLRFPVQVIANQTVTVQFQNAALTLTVTPQITAEGNIVLDLKVENNTPDFTREVLGIPSIRTSEAATRVLVANGGTTVIGGIMIEDETTTENRVPGLASLPIFGNLFKRTAVSHNTQEIMFFITPRILK